MDPERAIGWEEIEPALVRLVLPRSRANLVKVLLRALRVAVPARAASQHPATLRRAYTAEDTCFPAGLAARPWTALLAPAPPERFAAEWCCIQMTENGGEGRGGCDVGAVAHLAAMSGEEWNTGAPDELQEEGGEEARGFRERAVRSFTPPSLLLLFLESGEEARGFREQAVALLLSRFAADADLAGAALLLASVGPGGGGDRQDPGGGGGDRQDLVKGKDGLKKQAKGVLKRQQGNLFVWAAYARAERARGGVEEARKVLHGAMQVVCRALLELDLFLHPEAEKNNPEAGPSRPEVVDNSQIASIVQAGGDAPGGGNKGATQLLRVRHS
ncbi:hypothetical protein T484DRAFT_1774889 [Baffinella frigidus]|nr:hypothetical protein T484DRAFT_1774889 [Cryptophyta sp. CCMP2293]